MSEERVKLRDFQEALVEKIVRAGSGDHAPAMLGIDSGDERWLVDLAEAGEILPLPILTEVPLTKSWFAGLANIRGTLYAVSDLAAFHGAAPTPLKPQSRLLLAGARAGGNAALLICGTRGLVSLATLQAMPHEPAASIAETRQSWRGARYRDDEGQLWTRLQMSTLLSAPEFLDIAAQ
jgi:twitching motility protein PilI